MKRALHATLLLLFLAGPLGAAPITEAVDPSMIKARDWLLMLDKGAFEQAWNEADPLLKKRELDRFVGDVQKSRKNQTEIACRIGLYVEMLDRPISVQTSFDTRFADGTRVTEKVTLYYGDKDALQVAIYKVDGAQKGKGGCAG